MTHGQPSASSQGHFQGSEMKRIAAQATGDEDSTPNPRSALPGFTTEQCSQLLQLLNKGQAQH